MVNIEKILPIYKVEHGCILSMQGDITIVWRVDLPEIFTLSGSDYEAFHHALIKAITGVSKMAGSCRSNTRLNTGQAGGILTGSFYRSRKRGISCYFSRIKAAWLTVTANTESYKTGIVRKSNHQIIHYLNITLSGGKGGL